MDTNTDYELIQDYARKNYTKMFREPEGLLGHKFIVPGSCYSNCLWDWDSWLTNIALRQFVTDDISDYEKGCILNYLNHVDPSGRIPIVILPEYTMPDLKTEKDTNIHKPCLAQHAAFITSINEGDPTWLVPWFDRLCEFFLYYYRNCRHSTGLYFWNNDYAIGVDNDPSTFYRPPHSSGSIFLNCMMYMELRALSWLGKQLGKDVTFFIQEADLLKRAVRNCCYDEKDGFYYSVDLNLLPIDPNSFLHSGAPRDWDFLIQRIGSWSGFLAMWSGIATQEQAERMVRENLLDPRSFQAPYGVRTLSKYEKMYTVKPTNNPSCWLGPVWGISNYFVFRSLVKYGYTAEAEELAKKTLSLFSHDIRACGEMHEYYDPETGKPIINPGFQNWNLLALNMGAWLTQRAVVTEENWNEEEPDE